MQKIFKMTWNTFTYHSGSSVVKLSYMYSVAYKPFGKRSWIYLCPTALQRIQCCCFFASLHLLEQATCKDILSVRKRHNKELTQGTIVSLHISDALDCYPDKLWVWLMCNEHIICDKLQPWFRLVSFRIRTYWSNHQHSQTHKLCKGVTWNSRCCAPKRLTLTAS